MEDALLKWSGLSWIKRKAVDAFQSVLSFFQLKSGLRKRDRKSLTSGFFLILTWLSMQRKFSESVLIDLARQSLVEAFAGGEKEDHASPVDDETVSGVFVTLKRDGMLRGCRGCVEGTYPLRKTIWEVSRSSAFDDPRFNPMEQEEKVRNCLSDAGKSRLSRVESSFGTVKDLPR